MTELRSSTPPHEQLADDLVSKVVVGVIHHAPEMVERAQKVSDAVKRLPWAGNDEDWEYCDIRELCDEIIAQKHKHIDAASSKSQALLRRMDPEFIASRHVLDNADIVLE